MPVLAGVIFLLVIAVTSTFAPVIASHDITKVSLRERNVPPAWLEGGSSEHLLGTDHLGRDVFSRTIYGARTSLAVSLASILVAGIVGASVGLIAGYFGGGTGALDIRLADLRVILFAILPILLAQFTVPLALVLAGDPSFPMLILLIALLPGIIFSHQVWRETLSIKKGDAIGWVREVGASHFRIIIRHIFPKVASLLIILFPLLMVYTIVLEAHLSFLGMGMPLPTPAWGSMVADGRDRLANAWWVSAFPALAILLTVFSLFLLANHLRYHFGSSLRRE